MASPLVDGGREQGNIRVFKRFFINFEKLMIKSKDIYIYIYIYIYRERERERESVCVCYP